MGLIFVIILQGVTDSYSYFGRMHTYFVMHCEDMDLGSVSYLHWGACKVWYIVALSSGPKLEAAIRAAVPDHYPGCANIMRHKCFLLTPQFLSAHNIEHQVLVQHPGQYVVTFPQGYHQGLNLGPNLAEATNYANVTWVEVGEKSVQCDCKWHDDRKGEKFVLKEHQMIQLTAARDEHLEMAALAMELDEVTFTLLV